MTPAVVWVVTGAAFYLAAILPQTMGPLSLRLTFAYASSPQPHYLDASYSHTKWRYAQKLCTDRTGILGEECRMLLNQVLPKTGFKGAYDTWKILSERVIGVYSRRP